MKANLALIAAILLCSSTSVGQETTGDIRGRVRTAFAGQITGARITATSPDLLGTRHTLTASDGVFQLLALPPGVYTIQVSAVGFSPAMMQGVRVHLGRTTGLQDIELERSAVQLSEVKVMAARVTVDPTRTAIGATIDALEIASLPAERDYKSVIAVLPHVNTSYHGDAVNVGGSTGLENMYFIDGANVTAPWQAGTATTLPYNFVRSVEVRTGGYEAQYGRALGAIVNAVTYTGTNEFETNVFAFFTNSSLTAKPRAEPTLRETEAYSYDVGARISGPVLRDRMWFSAAYNPRRDHAEREITGLGTFSDDRRADVFAGKLTWQVRPSVSAELSVFGDPTTHNVVSADAGNGALVGLKPLNADPYLRLVETGGVATSLKAIVGLGSTGLLETILSRSTGRDRNGGLTERGRNEITYTDYTTQTVEGGSPYPIYVSQIRNTAGTRATISAGRHTLGFGAEYELGEVKRSSGNLQLLRNDTNQFLVDSQWVRGTFENLAPAAYVQNSWRVTDGLTVNAGLRWSRQTHRGASGGDAQRFGDEWQPRLGFNWHPGQRRSHRVFGSYGKFYQQVPLNLASIFYADSRAKLEHYSADPRRPGARPDAVDDFSIDEEYFAGTADGRSADHFDEFTAGYERLFRSGTLLTVRGMQRTLRSVFLVAFDLSRAPAQIAVIGTPGEGDLAFLPPARRKHTAIEVSTEGVIRKLRYRGSYVLSRTRGNFSGLYSSDGYFANPGTNFGLAIAEQARNSTGLLPNDRTHVLKLASSYSHSRALVAGAFLTWQSGTPLNDFGVGPFGVYAPTFILPRGSKGRTPAIWDVNLRLAHHATLPGTIKGRVGLDVLHVGSPRKAVRVDQQHYYGADALGNPTTPNPKYLQPLVFQPPMSARLGAEITF